MAPAVTAKLCELRRDWRAGRHYGYPVCCIGMYLWGSPLVAAAVADPDLLAARPAAGFDARSRLLRCHSRRRLA